MPAVILPIESAPRDGTRILARGRKGGWREMWLVRDQYEGEFWRDEFDSEPEPTEWIEMPISKQASYPLGTIFDANGNPILF